MGRGRFLGARNATRDARDMAVMLAAHSMRSTSALDYWDQLVCLHYGGRDGICAHFREQTIAETGMAWAGAPFAVPGTVALENSILSIVSTTRAFIFQSMAATNTYDKLASVALVSNNAGDFAGLRLDDASDNNYLEVVLCVSQASPTQWVVRTRRRTGGGAVTTQDGDAMATDPGFVLRMDLQFARSSWQEDWNAVPALHTNMGFQGWMYKPNAILGGTNLTFIPTRAGIVFSPGSVGEDTLSARADWFDIGRP